MRKNRSLERLAVDLGHMLACEEVESVLIVSGSLDNKIALRLSKCDNGLEQRAFALLYVLAERVEVGREYRRSREDSLVLLALALAEELLPPLAHEAEGYDHLLNDLYSACGRMAETVCCHPRLMARFKRFYRQVVYRIESAFCNGHELELSGDLSQEISMLELNIWFADNGKWDEIMAIDLLKSDPVEWSEEFENVIDEVEKELYEYFKDESRCMGFCFEFWSRKKALLARRGLEWRTPSEMNPRVIFD